MRSQLSVSWMAVAVEEARRDKKQRGRSSFLSSVHFSFFFVVFLFFSPISSSIEHHGGRGGSIFLDGDDEKVSLLFSFEGVWDHPKPKPQKKF